MVQPVILLSEPYTVEAGTVHKVSCRATRSVPEGYTLLEQGMLYARDVAGLDENNFKEGTAGVNVARSTDTDPNGVMTLNVKVANDTIVVSFRGYMVVRNDSTGNESVWYTGVVSRSYNG